MLKQDADIPQACRASKPNLELYTRPKPLHILWLGLSSTPSLGFTPPNRHLLLRIAYHGSCSYPHYQPQLFTQPTPQTHGLQRLSHHTTINRTANPKATSTCSAGAR